MNEWTEGKETKNEEDIKSKSRKKGKINKGEKKTIAEQSAKKYKGYGKVK